ncbi:EAL domain-containing protein [Aestuariispira insulae]|uniref:EAL domain-containing protein n=1 Tax=Aestuariispira insulae TaxID=1461337 RepID=A0A3D9HGD0_9PROT|nr:EAL domain-containing protein [Aestuariispira insulae]RED48533.1 EAL domain-containing protein [Aestuariispira insulae]
MGETNLKLFLRDIGQLLSGSVNMAFVRVDLTKLPHHCRRDRYLRMAHYTLQEFKSVLNAKVYPIDQKTIILIHDTECDSFASMILDKLTSFFELSPDQISSTLLSSYSFRDDRREILAYLQQLTRKLERRIERRIEDETPSKRPITVKECAALVEMLDKSSPSGLVRNQSVYAALSGNAPRPVFTESFVSVRDLVTTVSPDADFLQSRYLFMHFTQILDQKMLKLYGSLEEQQFDFTRSINLNVATILTPEFQHFRDTLRSGLAARYLIELQLTDIMVNLQAAQQAINLLEESGFRIVIDGVSPEFIPMLFHMQLQASYLKINCTSTADIEQNAPIIQTLMAQMDGCEFILARCEKQNHIALGRKLGFGLFQGFFVDSVYRNAKKPKPLKINSVHTHRELRRAAG